MLKSLRKSWKQFFDAEPGRRFQERYRRRRQEGESALSRAFWVVLGVVVFAAGIFFLPAPGPGTLILLVGAGLIAQEFHAAAKAMDWVEVRVRRLLRPLGKLWRRAPLPVKVLIVLVEVGAALAVGYLFNRLVSGS